MSIKILKNDNILVTEPGTNDLVVYSPRFEEIKRIQGIRGESFGKILLTKIMRLYDPRQPPLKVIAISSGSRVAELYLS